MIRRLMCWLGFHRWSPWRRHPDTGWLRAHVEPIEFRLCHRCYRMETR